MLRRYFARSVPVARAARVGYARAVDVARGSSMARMSCALWQLVHVGAAPAPPRSAPGRGCCPGTGLTMLPPGRLAFCTIAVVAVASTAGRLEVRVIGARRGILARLISCVPWQIGAGCGGGIAALARHAVNGRAVLLDLRVHGSCRSPPA